MPQAVIWLVVPVSQAVSQEPDAAITVPLADGQEQVKVSDCRMLVKDQLCRGCTAKWAR